MARYEINEKQNGIEIYFENKPSDDVLYFLRSNNWKWNNKKKCWYKTKNENSIRVAEGVCMAPEFFVQVYSAVKDAIKNAKVDMKKSSSGKAPTKKQKKKDLNKNEKEPQKDIKKKQEVVYSRQDLMEEREFERIAAVQTLKEKMNIYNLEWKPEYETLSVRDCKLLLRDLLQIKPFIQPRTQEELFKEGILNKREIRICLGNCSTCERTECLKQQSLD